MSTVRVYATTKAYVDVHKLREVAEGCRRGRYHSVSGVEGEIGQSQLLHFRLALVFFVEIN